MTKVGAKITVAFWLGYQSSLQTSDYEISGFLFLDTLKLHPGIFERLVIDPLGPRLVMDEMPQVLVFNCAPVISE